MPEGLHNEHRKRVKEEFIKIGFDNNTPPHKVLEMALFYAIPRIDTNEIAHQLINRFGSISGVLEADIDSLSKIKGIGTNAAIYLKMLLSISQIYINEKSEKPTKLQNYDEICEKILKRYIGRKNETFILFGFKNNGRLVSEDILCEGEQSCVAVSMRAIVETAIKREVGCVIIAHNHPDGFAIPSREDIEMTEKIQKTLSSINIKLLDHIIVGDGDYVSLTQSHQYEYIFK